MNRAAGMRFPDLRQAATVDLPARASNNAAGISVSTRPAKLRRILPLRAKKGGPFLGRR